MWVRISWLLQIWIHLAQIWIPYSVEVQTSPQELCRCLWSLHFYYHFWLWFLVCHKFLFLELLLVLYFWKKCPCHVWIWWFFLLACPCQYQYISISIWVSRCVSMHACMHVCIYLSMAVPCRTLSEGLKIIGRSLIDTWQITKTHYISTCS
jgi:hypothetical protein